MTLLLVGSTLLSALNVGCMWLLARRSSFGWLANIVVNTLWIPYDTITRQYGLYILTAACYAVSIHGWLKWRTDG